MALVDLKRRSFLFGAVAAPLTVPARKHFFLPRPRVTIQLVKVAWSAHGLGIPDFLITYITTLRCSNLHPDPMEVIYEVTEVFVPRLSA